MNPDDTDGPIIDHRFYYTSTLSYLTRREHAEIRKRLLDEPLNLRKTELAPLIAPLDETGGDAAFQVLRAYLDVVEAKIAKIVRQHSPSFWFHLHRRIKPMLSRDHTGKTDETTVHLVRRISELSYSKHGNLEVRDDLGPIIGMRLESFMDGAWYEATAAEFHSKLKAKAEFRRLKFTKQVVMTEFKAADLHDVYGVEGLAYEYWWASAVMRSVGKGSPIKWQNEPPRVLYCDQPVAPLCFEIYDSRINESGGFHNRAGTWTHGPLEKTDKAGFEKQEDIFCAQFNANPEPEEYPAWDAQAGRVGRGFGNINFHMSRFPLASFRANHAFMTHAFEKKNGVSLDAVFFAIWAASFLGVYKGFADLMPTSEERFSRSVLNWTNLQFRGYTMTPVTLPQMAKDAIFWANQLKLKHQISEAEALKGMEFIALSSVSQTHIALWSGGKRPILVPSFEGFMIDLAAIIPVLNTLFFGLRKDGQAGGDAFEDAVRDGIKLRGLELHHHGKLSWADANPREVDAAVRIGDRLILVECFAYDLPLDYEIGKPSVFDMRKTFILDKITQNESLAERIKVAPKGTNFDFSWAKTIEHRVVSPFVEFAWELNEPLIDADGVPRVMQVSELLNYLADGTGPLDTELLGMLEKARAIENPKPRWS
ncbi:MAG TPA: hypothetical protein VN723_13675 [Rhizomicrobium sp.]|nr:hypothetical protein [Rhizomicrobium sp.]